MSSERTPSAASWFRRTEIALWVAGLSFLAIALAATVERRSYQREQERALALRATGAAERTRLPDDMERAWALEPGTMDTAGPAAPPGLLAAAELAPRENDTAQGAGPALPSDREADDTPAAGAASLRAEPPSRLDRALDPGVVGRLEIPRLGVAAIVREGDDEETLDRAVGFIPGTARPGEGGNTALAGHRDTFFRPLRRIRAGDVIRLEAPPHTYRYRVEETRVVRPDEVSVLASRGSEELTLITCYPFRWVGPAPERFVVKATRVP